MRRFSAASLASAAIVCRIFASRFCDSPCVRRRGFHPRITKSELNLIRDLLQVLQAFETGIEGVVNFFTDGICPQFVEKLSSLTDERKCHIAHLY